MQQLSHFIDRLSDFIAPRKGLLPMIGLLLIVLNFILQLFSSGWLIQTNCLLHLGLVIAIFGFMVARAV